MNKNPAPPTFCRNCAGRGYIVVSPPPSPYKLIKCNVCKGTGTIIDDGRDNSE